MSEPTAIVRQSPWIDRPIDNTALADYMTCPRKYFYGMVLSMRREATSKPALVFGKAFHSALETHYKTGGNRDEVEKSIIMAWEQHDSPDDHRTWERCLATYDAFVKTYGSHDAEVASYGRTVGYPENPLVEIPTEVGWAGAPHPYTGRIDRIIEWNGLYYIEDHKTTSQLGAYYFQQFNPSSQMMGYTWLAQQITGLPIAGVRINAVGVLKKENKFARQIIAYSRDRMTEWAENYAEWITRLEASYELYASSVNATESGDPLTDQGVPNSYALELAAWPHNFNACAGKYGMCQYTSVCASPVKLRRRILEQDFTFAPWDPVAAILDTEAE